MISEARRRAFSLVELLVVVGIIAIIIALLVPAMMSGHELARMAACKNNLRQIGLALHTYQSLHERFPIGYVAAKHEDPLRTAPGWSFRSMMLPQLEQQNMWGHTNFRASTSHPVNRTVVVSNITIFTCPLDRGQGDCTALSEDGKTLGTFGMTSFAGNYGSGGDIASQPSSGNGFFVRNRAFTLDDFHDGLSNTIAVGERAAMHTKTAWVGAVEGAVCRITPGSRSQSREIGRGAVQVLAHVGNKPLNSADSGADEFFSPHWTRANFLMGDGSVRVVRTNIHIATLRALASRNGDELIGGSER